MLFPLFSIMANSGFVEVPRWQPYDFAFAGPAESANPFLLHFEARITTPGGETFVLPGFYDGQGLWKIRVAPTVEGTWKLTTHSEVPELDGVSVSFACVPNANPAIHGRLRTDPAHPHHFVYEDGTRYFLLGYECDWLWALDLDRTGNDQPTLERFLDKLAVHGFNHLLVNSFAYDTPWHHGKRGPDDYGPPPLIPWEGTHDRPDHGRLNLAYWQHYDRMMQALYERGLVAHLMVKVYNKYVNWPPPGSREDELYFRWLIARYAAFPNLVWDFSKEAQNEKDLSYKLARLRMLRGEDPYHHLVTVHDDSEVYDAEDYDEVVDFQSDQNHSRWHETLLRQRARRAWPVVNVEFGYEHGPGGIEDRTYQVTQAPEELTRRAWAVVMAGGYAVYYYTYTAWDVIRPDDTPPGYRYFHNLRRFFEGTRWWELEPADELVSAGYCLAAPGREYVIFLPQAGPVTLQCPSDAPLSGRWYHALRGEYAQAGQLSGPRLSLKPPREWAGDPVALHLSQ